MSKIQRAPKEGTPGQRSRAAELLRLGRAEFGELLPGEVKMLRAAAMGKTANLARDPDDDRRLWFAPYKYEGGVGPWLQWEGHRRIRAGVLRWLCVFEHAQTLVDAMGVNIRGARIDGQLRLDGARVPFRLGIFACACPDGIIVVDTHLDGLVLNGSVLGNRGLFADGLKVTGSINLRDGFVSHGAVRLLGASIGGNLDCLKGAFNNEGGNAINADRLKVTGSVYLGDGFVSHGAVRLIGASIGRNLSCTKGAFNNDGGDAIDLEGVVVEGAMLLRDAASWSGGIDLTSAQVNSLADCPPAYPGRLWLSDFRYRAIYPEAIGSVQDRLAWLAKSDRTSKPRDAVNYLPDPQPYRHLASVLREQGHEEDARVVLRACARRRAWARFENRYKSLNSGWFNTFITRMLGFRKRVLSLGDWPRKKPSWVPLSQVFVLVRGLLSLMYGAIAGHGYDRWRPLYWVGVFIFAGALIFSGGQVRDAIGSANPYPPMMQPTQALAIKDATNENSWMADYPAFRPLAYSADAFLPLVNLHQESYWTPKDSWVKSFYLPFHIIMGWIVTTLAAVSITGLVRRERE